MSSASSRWMPIAGLSALVILNVVLIALLVVRPSSPTVAGREAPYVSPSMSLPDDEASPVTKSEPAELPTSGSSQDLEPAQRLIVNADSTTAWRATIGDCDDPGTLERTVDSGETWEELPLDVAPVSRMRVLTSQNIFVIGGDADCDPTYLSSSTAGASWTTNDQFLVGSWFIVPKDRDVVATPVGEIEAPCEATAELTALDASSAAVRCGDGGLAITSDGGASWDDVTTEFDPLALGVADDGYALAGTHEACGDGLAFAFVDSAGRRTEDSTCVDASVEGAELAISASSGAVWLWAGNEVLVVQP